MSVNVIVYPTNFNHVIRLCNVRGDGRIIVEERIRSLCTNAGLLGVGVWCRLSLRDDLLYVAMAVDAI